jgi:SPP1 family predicted phage head-tail adaptor
VISAGRMNERVGLLAPTEVRSPSGEASISFATAATVWGSVTGMSSDILQAQQADVIATHRIFIRYRSDVTYEYRLSWRGKTLEVASIADRENRTMIEILAREKV